jgi:MFS family permease
MTSDAASEHGASEPSASKQHASEHQASQRHSGVLVVWRQTSNQTRALLAGIFVSKLAGFVQVFLVLFLTHRGYSPSQAGVALGLYGAGAVLGTFGGGWLSDRLTPRTVTSISMLGSAVLIVSVLYLRVYPLILVAVIMVSTVGQLYRPAAQAMITELTPPEHLVMVTAMYRLCLNLGTTAAPLIGVALVSVSYDLLFWAEALAAVTYGLIALKFLPRGARPAGNPSGAGGNPSSQGGTDRSGYLAVLADWRFSAYLVAMLLLAIVYCQYTAALPLAIVHGHLSLWWYSAVVSANAIIVATCEVVATRYVQAWSLRVVALCGTALTGLGYCLYAIALTPGYLIAGTLIWTLAEIIGGPTVWSYPGMVAPPRLRGRYFGAMQSSFGVGNAVGPVIGVALWYHVGQQVWLWAALAGALSAVFAQVGMYRPQPQALRN